MHRAVEVRDATLAGEDAHSTLPEDWVIAACAFINEAALRHVGSSGRTATPDNLWGICMSVLRVELTSGWHAAAIPAHMRLLQKQAHDLLCLIAKQADMSKVLNELEEEDGLLFTCMETAMNVWIEAGGTFRR